MAPDKHAEVVVVGSANVDLIMKAEKLPRPGETVTNAAFSRAFGGKGANQAVAVARAMKRPDSGAAVSFVAAVGRDADADDMVESWTESGIDTRFVVRTDVHTGCASIMVGEGGENLIAAAPGANAVLTPERFDEISDQLTSRKLILLQFETPAETVERVLQFGHSESIPVVWNVAPMKEVRKDLIGMAPVLVVNETEAEMIVEFPVDSTDSASRAATDISSMGPDTVIVTLGRAGSLVLDSGSTYPIPAFAVDAVDTTAAGDTYCGCLVAALAEGKDLRQAVVFASAGAALSVGRLGAQPSIPWRGEIDSFLTERGA